MSKFGLWRVCQPNLDGILLTIQYQFRLKALAGEIPGVNKASW